MPLLSAVIETNLKQPNQVITLLKKHFASLEDIRITILGLSFKPDTDDIRESPAIVIIKELITMGAVLKAYDPEAHNEIQKLFPGNQLELCETLEKALKDVDAIVLVTRWDQFNKVPE